MAERPKTGFYSGMCSFQECQKHSLSILAILWGLLSKHSFSWSSFSSIYDFLCRYLILCAQFRLWARVQVHLWILYHATIHSVVTVTTSQTAFKRFIKFIIILLKFYWLKMKAKQFIILGLWIPMGWTNNILI